MANSKENDSSSMEYHFVQIGHLLKAQFQDKVGIVNFLGVFKLKVVGQIIGWLAMIIGLLLVVHFGKAFGSNFKSHHYPIEHFVGILASCCIVYAAKELIDGSRMGNSEKIKPAITVALCTCVFPVSLMIYQSLAYVFLVALMLFVIIFLYFMLRVFEGEEKAASQHDFDSTVNQLINTVLEIPEPATFDRRTERP